jgi:fermentation-respiration switch protein FrsA (DUF1100 family)
MIEVRRLMNVALVTLVVALAALAVAVRWLEPRLAFFPDRGESETPRDFGVPFDAVTIETQDGERLRAWVMHASAPRARVVYFHGNGGNLSNWAPIVAGIVRRGYSVVAFDYRGYGVSSGTPTERGVYRDADAVVAAAWRDADPHTPLVYWGRSLGGTVAAYAATVRAPGGLIVESAFPDARATVRSSFVLVALSFLATYRFPTAEWLNRARVPVLQLHGDHDRVIPIELGRELHDRLTVRKQFVVIAGGDHNDGAPSDPRAYWDAIERFVASLPPVASSSTAPRRN